MDKVWNFLLLCPAETEAALSSFLTGVNPDARVRRAATPQALRRSVKDLDGDVRLLSFLNDLIVPSDVLSALRLAPYNIHGGPPEYPGSHANSFAIFDAATSYGVTAHEISPRVDEGAIVGVERFAMPPRPERLALADIAFAAAIRLYARVASRCAVSRAPLAAIGESWGGRKTTKAEFAALCARMPFCEAERERLVRACGRDFRATCSV